MIYDATVRIKNGPNVKMSKVPAIDIYTVARMIRAKYGLYMDKPHKGFIITEHRPLDSKVKSDG